MRRKSTLYRTPVILAVLVVLSLSCNFLTKNLSTGGQTESSTEPQQNVASQSGLVTQVVMSEDVSGDNFDPVNVTDTFAKSTTLFHCVVTIEDAPSGTSFKAIWKVDQVEGIETGYEMGSYELTSEGSRNLDFTFEPNSGALPVGTYIVEIYVNGSLDTQHSFTVSE